MSSVKLSEIITRLKSLLTRATMIPWQVSGTRHPSLKLGKNVQLHAIGPDDDAVAMVFYDTDTGQGFADAQLIVEAINTLPDLIVATERLETLSRAAKPFLMEINRLEREYGFDRPDQQYQCMMIELIDLKRLRKAFTGFEAED